MGGESNSESDQDDADPSWGPERRLSPAPLRREDYTILRTLKDTLFGKVHRARVNATGEIVAIKESVRANADSGTKTGGQTVMENLRDEVRAMKRLARLGTTEEGGEGGGGGGEGGGGGGGKVKGKSKGKRKGKRGKRKSPKKGSSSSSIKGSSSSSSSGSSSSGGSGPHGVNPAGHPNLINLIGFMGDATHYWTVLEFCQGSDFFDYVSTNFPAGLPGPQAIKLYRQLMSTLAFVHDAGLCHLDVSLENTMITDEGDLKVIDFGVARLLRRNEDGDVEPFPGGPKKPGKMGYMAPELFEGRTWRGELADVWSSGVMLFIMLTGVPPFRTATFSDKCFKLIITGKLRKLLAHWGFLDRLDPRAVDLLELVLCHDSERLHAHDILEHPWLAEEE